VESCTSLAQLITEYVSESDINKGELRRLVNCKVYQLHTKLPRLSGPTHYPTAVHPPWFRRGTHPRSPVSSEYPIERGTYFQHISVKVFPRLWRKVTLDPKVAFGCSIRENATSERGLNNHFRKVSPRPTGIFQDRMQPPANRNRIAQRGDTDITYNVFMQYLTPTDNLVSLSIYKSSCPPSTADSP
jgi:hypothetical protein